MRFSLVIATINRTTELRKLLVSLNCQTHRNFEVIVVDQNTDERLLPLLDEFGKKLQIRRITCAPGLSRARNAGVRQATGDVVCFPDDDCWYPEDLLSKVHRLFTTNPVWDGIIADSVDESGKPSLPWRDRSGKLTLAKCWRRAVTYAVFLRMTIMKEMKGFDETLGPGTDLPWGCGEDNDLILKALKAGAHFQYESQIRVFHPKLFLHFDQQGCAKRHRYALGDGKLLRKHPMPLWWQTIFFLMPLCRASFSSLRLEGKETYFHWLTFKGRLTGFLSAEPLTTTRSAVSFERKAQHEEGAGLPLEAFSAGVGKE